MKSKQEMMNKYLQVGKKPKRPTNPTPTSFTDVLPINPQDNLESSSEDYDNPENLPIVVETAESRMIDESEKIRAIEALRNKGGKAATKGGEKGDHEEGGAAGKWQQYDNATLGKRTDSPTNQQPELKISTRKSNSSNSSDSESESESQPRRRRRDSTDSDIDMNEEEEKENIKKRDNDFKATIVRALGMEDEEAKRERVNSSSSSDISVSEEGEKAEKADESKDPQHDLMLKVGCCSL